MKNRFLTSRDYARLFERAKRILDHEFSKPSAEWDEGLIEELEETMLYCAERKKVLYSEEQSKRLQPSFKLRRAFVIVIAVFAFLVLSASVAQAAGFRVWSAIVHWDLNYLRVDYTGNLSETPNDQDINNGNSPVEEPEAITLTFESFDDLVTYMGNRIMFPSESMGIQFISASVTEDDEATILHTVYNFEDDRVIIDNIIPKSGESDTISIGNFDMSVYDEVYERDINSIKCIFGLKEGRSYCSFAYNLSSYLVVCDAGQEDCVSIVESILRGVIT